MVQSSSQHDKCQVWNMHTYSLELVHFPIIPSSLTHSLNSPLYLPITVLELVFVPIPVCVVGYLGRWTKEAGCHVCGILKRRVVRPVRNLSR